MLSHLSSEFFDRERTFMNSHRLSLVLVAGLASSCAATSTSGPAATLPRPSLSSTEASGRAIEVDGEVRVSGALLPPMPVAVTSFGAAADASHLYVLGGYFGTPHSYSREGQSRSILRLAIDGSSDREQVGELEDGVQGLAAVAHAGKVCRFGGNEIHNAAGEAEEMRSVDEAECLDLASGRLSALPALPEGRSSHGAALVGDTVYVAGGWAMNGSPATSHFHRTIVALDLSDEQPTWRSIDAPFERRAVGVAAAGGKLYVVGGLDPSGEMSRRVDVFDPATGEFARGPDFPSDAFGVAAVGSGDAVYASARDGVVYRLRAGDAAWTPVARQAFGRFFHQLVPAGEHALVAVGGISGMHDDGRTRHVERVELNATSPSVAVFEMRYPGAAKNRQGLAVHGDFLYLFGGNNSLEQHDFEPTNFVSEGLRIHLPSMRWERVTDYPVARQTMQVITEDERAIFVGGFGHDGGAAVSHAEAFAYDFESGTFEPRAGLPESRTQFGLAEHDGSLWVFGGLNYDPSRQGEAAFDHVRSVLRAPADLSSPFEPAGVDLPGPRRAFAGAVLGDRYYLVGGMREGFGLVDDCYAFEFERRAFTPIACPSAPRLSADLVALGGKLYLVGGSVLSEGGVTPATTIEAFDPATGTWSTVLDELPFDGQHMRALAFGDRLLLVSTHDAEPRFHAAVIDPVERRAGATRPTQVVAPAP
jgi:N-acetylneuraminic acid mutarotase